MQDKTVAKAISFETKGDRVFVTFEVTDQNFKKTIKEQWSEDPELYLVLKDKTSKV